MPRLLRSKDRMSPYYDEDGITIYHADCRDMHEWLIADVVVTDPPYGIGWKRSANHQRASKAHAGIANDHDTSARDEALSLVGGRPAVVFGSFYAPYPPNVAQVLVWHKPPDSGLVGSTTGFRRDAEAIFLTGQWPTQTVKQSSVLHTQRGMSSITSETGHPHTKPLGLMVQLLSMCPPGLIADPFMGSGSTLVAAKHVGRQAIGVEIEERYCDMAARRLAQGVLPLEGTA